MVAGKRSSQIYIFGTITFFSKKSGIGQASILVGHLGRDVLNRIYQKKYYSSNIHVLCIQITVTLGHNK